MSLTSYRAAPPRVPEAVNIDRTEKGASGNCVYFNIELSAYGTSSSVLIWYLSSMS